VPDKEKDDKSEKPKVSRLQKMRDDLGNDEFNPPMPPVQAPHLLEYFYEVGPAIPNGMGCAPISFAEIEKWQSVTGIEVQSWEARILRRLSVEYCNESHIAQKIDAEAPWVDAPHIKPKQSILVARLKAAFY
jgi:hypothetical protein